MWIAAQDPRLPQRAWPRSFVAFAAVASGMLAARHLPDLPAAACFAAGALAVAAAGLFAGRACRVALVVATCALGAGWFAGRIHERSTGSILGMLPFEAPVISMEVTALEPARVEARPRDPLHPMGHLSEPRSRFRAAVDGLVDDSGVRPCTGRVVVALHGPTPASLKPGDRLLITGSFRPVPAPLNPGERDRRLWAAQDGLAGTLRTPGGELIRPLPPAEGLTARIHTGFLRLRAMARERAGAFLGDTDSEDPRRAFLAALILGQEEPSLYEVRSAFNRLGLAHALAISGFHLTVLAWVGLFGLRLTGDRGWIEPAAVALLVLLYLFVLPVQAPVWRSGLMTLGLLTADALGRRYDRLALLGWTAVAVVLYRPMDLWSLGFQLSFGLVALLIWLGPVMPARLFGGLRLERTMGPPSAAAWTADALKAYVSNTLLCCVAAAPLVLHQTGLVSFGAIASSLLVLPCIVALLGVAYAVLLVSCVLPAAGAWAGEYVARLAGWTIDLVVWMDGVPYASASLPSVSLAWTVAATALAIYWFTRGHTRDWPGWGAGALAAAWLAAEVTLGPRLPPSDALRIDTLAVGDGSCHVLRSRGEAMLWDCGSLTPGVGRALVPRAVRALGVWRAPTVVISHPNLDHFNGLLDAAEALGVRRVLVGAVFMEQAERSPDGAESFVVERLRGAGIAVEVLQIGDAITLGDAKMTILSPPAAGARWAKDNDRSLVAAFDVTTAGGVRRLLMTGDIEADAIGFLSESGLDPPPAIMEAPHHGSARDASIKFVAAADPWVVLQSTGPERAGDGRWETVRRFRDWYTTATDGAAWAVVRRDGAVRSGSLRR